MLHLFRTRTFFLAVVTAALLTGPLPADAQSGAGAKQCGGPRTKIVGGSNARLDDWPGQAAIRLHVPSEKLAQYSCGGTAIADRWVLTAAHCLPYFIDTLNGKVRGKDGLDYDGRLEVVLGAGDLKVVGVDRIFPVERVIIHERYLEKLTPALSIVDDLMREKEIDDIAIRHGNDIALLRLARSWPGPYASLVLSGEPPAASTQVLVAGFGRTATNQNKKALTRYVRRDNRGDLYAGSDILQEVAVAVTPHALCQSRAKLAGGTVGSGQICAGLEQGGKDSCQGDSGGPLVERDAANCPHQVGLVSWGPGACASKDAFAVYTRLAHYKGWIEQHTGPLKSTTLKTADRATASTLSSVQLIEAQTQLENLLGPAKGRISIAIRGGNRVKLGGKVVFEARSDIAGRLAIIDINASREVMLIYPNQFVADDDLGRITAGSTIQVPGPGYPGFTHFEAVEPVGNGRLIALVVPEDFPLDRAIVDRKALTKGWAPRNDPPSYMMRLIRQIEVALGSARSRAGSSGGGNELERWGYSIVEYEITR